ncbi:hypothetical protein [Shinella sp. G-2]|uniref:hypothetical protein n=1 Tax=Shinella sp. G-2 TaxID=3133141 RepID=UPI003D03858A
MELATLPARGCLSHAQNSAGSSRAGHFPADAPKMLAFDEFLGEKPGICAVNRAKFDLFNTLSALEAALSFHMGLTSPAGWRKVRAIHPSHFPGPNP